MTRGVYDNCYSCWNGCPTNASDECRSLGSLLTDADGLRLPCLAKVANIDVVTARGEISAGERAQCDVGAAGCVVAERANPDGRVEAAGCVEKARSNTGGRVALADGV